MCRVSCYVSEKIRKIAVPHIMMADTLFNIRINFPDGSSLPSNLPANAKLKNQIQETRIQEIIKIIFAVPLKDNELVPITPIVSIMACGFNNDTEAANAI